MWWYFVTGTALACIIIISVTLMSIEEELKLIRKVMERSE